MNYILDNKGNKYLIKNINIFFKHLQKFHTKNGIADNSIHEENGYYFTITEDFYQKIKEFYCSKNNNS